MGVMYSERCADCFKMIAQINICADGSTHSTKDILASVAYSHDYDLGCVARIQHMPVGPLSPAEVDVTVLAAIARKTKLNRFAAFRQLQALSHQVHILTAGRLNLDSFALLPGVRPVKPGERRTQVVVTSEDPFLKIRAILIKEGQGVVPSYVPVLPQDPGWWFRVPILVTNLDQGSIGAAGMAFALSKSMVHVKFDKIHRAVRDYKLAIAHSLRGLFLRTQLHSSYIWSLNYKPFGGGAFFQNKQSMLESFIGMGSQTGTALWARFRERIASDMGLPGDIADDELWDRMATLPSFENKGTLIKMSRWFSWNQVVADMMYEWHAFKMIMEDTLLNQDDATDNFEGVVPIDGVVPAVAPSHEDDAAERDKRLLGKAASQKVLDPRRELSLMKETLGGFKLAYHLMTHDLFWHVKILYMTTKPLWEWYVHEVSQVKSPEDGLQASIHLSLDKWQQSAHLRQTVAVLQDENALRPLYESGLDQSAMKIQSLTEHLLKQRVWTLARHSAPPEAYAGILSDDDGVRKDACELLKRQHRVLLQFEAGLARKSSEGREPSGLAKRLATDLSPILSSPPTRLMMDAFEASEYYPRQGVVPGCHLLRCLLKTFADNKVIEDIHKVIRQDANANGNCRMTDEHIQEVAVNSGVLEARSIRHMPALEKEEFCNQFKKTTPSPRRAAEFKAKSHKMSPHWHDIMGKKFKKNWGTLTEESLEKAAAAWSWLQSWAAHIRAQNGSALRDGVFSKLAPAFHIMRHMMDDERLWLCLGGSTWATIMWPVVVQKDAMRIDGVVPLDEDDVYYVLDAEGQATWQHLDQPTYWWVVETKPTWFQGKVCRKSMAVEHPLPKYFLTNPKRLRLRLAIV